MKTDVWQNTGNIQGHMKDRQDVYYGHKEIETVTHNANNNAKRKEQHESNWGRNKFQSSPSAEKCKCLRKDLHHLLKHTCSLNRNLKYLEGNLVSTANTDSNNSKYRPQLDIQWSMSEHWNLKMRDKTHNILNLRDLWVRSHYSSSKQYFLSIPWCIMLMIMEEM